MEFIKRTFSQYSKIFEGFTSSQKATLLLVSAIIVGGFGYLMYSNSESAYVPLFAGKTLSAEELSNAQQGLREKGLSDFKVVAQKIMVHRNKLNQAKAALLVQDGLPSGWAEEMEKQVNNTNIFDSNRNNQTKAKIALAKELRRVLRAVPQIHDASVIWAQDRQRSFPVRSKKVTASVWLTPERNHELTSRLVNSVKSAVAMSISGLKKSDITIIDQNTGKANGEDEDDFFNGKLLEVVKNWEERFKKKVQNQLSYIPDVLVAVNVKLNDLKTKKEWIRKLDPKGVVPVLEETNRKDGSDNSQPSRSEPGVPPNTPDSLRTGNGNVRTRTNNNSKTKTINQPSFSEVVQEYLQSVPEAVNVSVSIPEDYFTKVSEIQSNATTGNQPPKNRAQILTDIQEMVAKTVGQDPASNTIAVNSYIPVDAELPELEESMMDSVSSSMSQWGGPIVMGIFAVWALLMLKKSFNRLPELPEDSSPATVNVPQPQPDDEQEEFFEKRESERDRLQTVVRDNPEMTAAVISSWLQAAK